MKSVRKWPAGPARGAPARGGARSLQAGELHGEGAFARAGGSGRTRRRAVDPFLSPDVV
jgi:hypothetical protein